MTKFTKECYRKHVSYSFMSRRVWASVSHESAGKRVPIKERRHYSQGGQLLSLGHTIFIAVRYIKDTPAKTWYSKHKASREFSPALLCSVVGFIFPFLLFLLLRVSVIFIHFNSRCEIVGCHLPFCRATGQNYKWVDINGSPEFSAVLVDGIENVLI